MKKSSKLTKEIIEQELAKGLTQAEIGRRWKVGRSRVSQILHPEKYKIYQKAYQKTYQRGEKYKAYQKAYQRAYQKSEKRQAYQKGEKFKAYQRAYYLRKKAEKQSFNQKEK